MFKWPWTSKKKIERMVAKTDATVIKLKCAKTKLDRALDELEGILNDAGKATPSPDKRS